ncbi:MAG: flagellar hook-length control protein FliK [Treponema sp.]|nr:flagellar hook-length control protein FliK [Treponema sp.]
MQVQISDINVSQQLKNSDLKLSEHNQISLQKSESSNFLEMISSYQKESKSQSVDENQELPAKEQKVENEKSEKVEKSEEKAESPKAENSEKSQKAEKSEKVEKTEKTEEGQSDEKVKKCKTTISKTEETKGEKEKGKVSKKSDKEEIVKEEIAEKPKNEIYSRMDEISASVNNQAENKKADIKDNEKDEIKIDFDGNNSNAQEGIVESNQDIQLAQLDSSDLNNSEDFKDALDFAKDNKPKEKITLDKDGKITVEDLRSKEIPAEKEKPALKTELKIENDNTASITMDLAKNAEADVLSLNNQTAASNGSNFQTMLNNQIQANAPEFVKAGNIVLKDNNQGTINLILHPDDLGNVKIHLTMDGKSLSAHITVATKEALQVFKDNSETLREAFIKSGFDAGNFDVSYSGENNSFADSSDFNQRNDGSQLFGRKMYGNNSFIAESSSMEIPSNSQNLDDFSINIVA